MRDEHFGAYRLISRLATGGMGETWRAERDDGAGVSKDVVLKRVLRDRSDDPRFVEAFIAEAQLSSRLSHGNIAQVIEFGEVEGECFLALEYVAGQSVLAAMNRAVKQGLRAMPAPFATYLVSEMLKGLQHAHLRTGAGGEALHIVHRDISPDNVLLSYEGEVKLVDFGIAKARLEGRAETEPGMVKGKYLYFSPEQARGEALDARSDVFSAGIVLYTLLAGRLPDEGQTHVVMHKRAMGELTDVGEAAPWVAEPLRQVVRRALAAKTSDRFASALDFQQALAAAATELKFPGSQVLVSGMMTWLFGPELSALGRTVVVPAAARKMIDEHQRLTNRPVPAQARSVGAPATPTAQPEAVRVPAAVTTAPGVERPRSLKVVVAVGAVAVLAFGGWRLTRVGELSAPARPGSAPPAPQLAAPIHPPAPPIEVVAVAVPVAAPPEVASDLISTIDIGPIGSDPGIGVPGAKRSLDIGLTSSEPVVTGSLDKELIRKVIRANSLQIRYCYEMQLNRFPKLSGKVAVKFVVSATGSVASANVSQSTVKNAELDTCVASRVKTWQFPKPSDGGLAIVTYPFIFSPDPPAARPSAKGKFDQQAINDVVKTHQRTLTGCLKEIYRPGEAQKIPIRFTIGNDGVVTSVKVDNPEYANGRLPQCLLEQLRTWPFKPFEGEGPTVDLNFNVGK